MDRRVTPPKRVTSPTRGSPPLCKQALNLYIRNDAVLSTSNLLSLSDYSALPPYLQCCTFEPHYLTA